MSQTKINVEQFEEFHRIPKLSDDVIKKCQVAASELNELLAFLEKPLNDIFAPDLVLKAVDDLKTAVSFKSPGFPIVKFSKIKKSHRYLNGEKNENLHSLRTDFPSLYSAVCRIREHSSSSEVWNYFKRFLFSLAYVLESGHMSLPTSKMIEKRRDLAKQREVWHSMRQYMEDCCNFVLGDITNVQEPKFEFLNNPELEDQLKKFVSEIHDASNALKNSIF